jgi:hypothetical protein
MRYKIETERENLFDVNMVIAMRVRLEGEVIFDKLEKAFYGAVAAYEILNSKVIIEDDGNAYYVDCNEPSSSFSKSELRFEELINANEKVRFRIENGEYIRGFLSPDGLVFLMHHMGGDGKSLLYFIETFMRILSGEDPAFVPFTNLTVEDLPEDSRLPYLYRLFVSSWNRRWLKMKRVFTFNDLDGSFNDFWSKHNTKTVVEDYDKERLEDLLARSKEAGCSLTSYLVALWIKDIPHKADVGFAVDGRLNDARVMGNFATGIHINYRYDSGKSTGENARKINALMKKKLSDPRFRYSVLHLIGGFDPTLIDTLSLEAAGAFHTRETARFADIMNYGKKKKDLSITNLMRADIRTDYGDYRIKDIAFVPPVVSYGKNLIGIITVNDKMIVTMHVYQ